RRFLREKSQPTNARRHEGIHVQRIFLRVFVPSWPAFLRGLIWCSDAMRIVVAMSGGVDSSVAAALLAEQGHDVIGLSMQLYDQWEGQTSFGSCCSIDDLHDARRVAAAINIPHYILNFERQFNEQVVSNFVREYAAGRTPLPCAHCNSDLKFATLADRARGVCAESLGTRPPGQRRPRPRSC